MIITRVSGHDARRRISIQSAVSKKDYDPHPTEQRHSSPGTGQDFAIAQDEHLKTLSSTSAVKQSAAPIITV